MTSARFLVAILLFLSTSVFAQENQPATSHSQDNPELIADSHGPATGSIPLRIDPLGSDRAAVPQDPLARLESSLPPMFNFRMVPGQKVLFFPAPGEGFIAYPDLLGDTVCLKIRSYVMKRDSKDSDATHLVGYSTCQPSKKFQVRSVVETPQAEK
jgi:hypothetical protein